MSEAHTDNPKSRSQGQPVEFRVAARLESLAVIRTLVSALGTLEDLDLDAVADLRLALDEACTRLIRSAAKDSTLVVSVEPREDDLRISVSTTCMDDDILRPGTFSWHVISSLTDDVQTFHDGADADGPTGVFGITMIARRLETDR
ncbi:MAG: anti-sigma factor [Mycobacterium sp.]|jgi:serine/threonine-protein kinase RsbW|nr:anti-sigma factor [Mycobacterium sp.]